MKINKLTTNNTFAAANVEVRDPLVEDLIEAERMTGKNQGFEFLIAVIARCCTFDGKTLFPDELRKLPSADFLAISESLALVDMKTSPKELSILSEKENSPKAK